MELQTSGNGPRPPTSASRQDVSYLGYTSPAEVFFALGLAARDVLALTPVKVHCLQLGGTDLTSAAGRMTVNVLAAVAQFERDLLIERTQSGLQRAWVDDKKSGRRATPSVDQRAEVLAALEGGESVSALARRYETSRQTILRAKVAA